jgi:uncharacterized oxidoreductase
MQLTGNTILLTGGSEGIGLAIAERFLKLGNQVIVCGRREDKLQEAKQKNPALHIKVTDLAIEADRVELARWAKATFPAINVLVNNAGIQRRFKFTQPQDWSQVQSEIVINYEAPVHLTMFLLPHLLEQAQPVIMNVSSGLAFVPAAFAPVYASTKAAIHSLTMALRQQLSNTACEVIEIAPPSVNTNLGGVGLHNTGVPLDEFADAVFKGLEKGEPEITYGFSAKTSRASREELDQIFKQMSLSLP